MLRRVTLHCTELIIKIKERNHLLLSPTTTQTAHFFSTGSDREKHRYRGDREKWWRWLFADSHLPLRSPSSSLMAARWYPYSDFSGSLLSIFFSQSLFVCLILIRCSCLWCLVFFANLGYGGLWEISFQCNNIIDGELDQMHLLISSLKIFVSFFYTSG